MLETFRDIFFLDFVADALPWAAGYLRWAEEYTRAFSSTRTFEAGDLGRSSGLRTFPRSSADQPYSFLYPL
jgi:hypothetical protein